MIESVNKKWEEVSLVNNLKWEYKILNNDIPILTAQDYWKYPDKVSDFFRNGYWWENLGEDNARPGKSFHIQDEMLDWFNLPISRSIAPLFGLQKFKGVCTFGNCFNSNMPLSIPESVFPHVDLDDSLPLSEDTHLAININITKTESPVQTGFWTFNNLRSALEFSHNDKAIFRDFFYKLGNNSLSDNATWFQIEDYGPWKFADKVDMCYNSIVVYPSHFFHNPILKDTWFDDHDRVTISSFLNTSPSDLDFPQKDIDHISYAWEFFHLDKIHNYHPHKTKVPV